MTKNRHGNSASFWGSGMTTTISLTLVLLLLGLTVLVGVMGNRISSYVKENIIITVELSDKIKESDILKTEQQLKETPYFKDIRYISKEDINKQLIIDLGKDPEEVLGYNPASNCLEVKLNAEYANSDSIKVVEKLLRQKKIAQDVLYNQDDLDIVNSNLSKVGLALLVLAIVLMLISFTLIRNTIRLNIYAKRFTINTMQLVGATNSFIRRPFLKQMLLYGFIAAILANMLITVMVYYVTIEYVEFISILSLNDLIIIYTVVFILGILLTSLATIFAVNKYLRINRDNLYHI